MFIVNEFYILSEAEWLLYYMDNYIVVLLEELYVYIYGFILGKIVVFIFLMFYVVVFGFSFGLGNLCFDNKFLEYLKYRLFGLKLNLKVVI